MASDLANRSPSTAPGALLAATESQLPLPSLPMSFRMSNVATDDENERLSPREYRIRKSDTLADIAERYLGSSDRAGELFDANRDVLRSPDLLPVGTMLRIPRQPTGN